MTFAIATLCTPRRVLSWIPLLVNHDLSSVALVGKT